MLKGTFLRYEYNFAHLLMPDSVCSRVRDGLIAIRARGLPMFLFDLNMFDPKLPEAGLLRSQFLLAVRMFRVLAVCLVDSM